MGLMDRWPHGRACGRFKMKGWRTQLYRKGEEHRSIWSEPAVSHELKPAWCFICISLMFCDFLIHNWIKTAGSQRRFHSCFFFSIDCLSFGQFVSVSVFIFNQCDIIILTSLMWCIWAQRSTSHYLFYDIYICLSSLRLSPAMISETNYQNNRW